MNRFDAIVVGAGVIGLTTAVLMAEHGYHVEIIAKNPPERTTSSVAAALFYPYKAHPLARVATWTQASLRSYRYLAQDSSSGVQMRPMLEPTLNGKTPWWTDLVGEHQQVVSDELPAGYAGGVLVSLPVIETPVYLPYLVARFKAAGGALRMGSVNALRELSSDAKVIVNCTGLGARAFGDEELYPIRGQVVRVAAPDITYSLMCEEAKPTYMIPRRDGLILGGTATEHDWGTEVRPSDTKAILRQCARFHSPLASATPLEVMVGLRPGRSAVRLQTEPHAGGTTIIHNYGHGGAGFTLAWGCAEDVAALAKEALEK